VTGTFLLSVMDGKRRQDLDGDISSLPEEKRARMKGKKEIVLGELALAHQLAKQGVSGLEIINQLMKEKEKFHQFAKEGDGQGMDGNASDGSRLEGGVTVNEENVESGVTGFVQGLPGAWNTKRGIIDQLRREEEATGEIGKVVQSQRGELVKVENTVLEEKIKVEESVIGREVFQSITGDVKEDFPADENIAVEESMINIWEPITAIVKEEVIATEEKYITPIHDWVDPLASEETVVLDEVVIDEDVEASNDSADILQPVVILDGQSIGRVTKFLYLSSEQKLSKAFDHFAKKGFKVVIFLPKSMVKKVKDARDEVKAAMKLTVKELPRTHDNVWGLDKWEVVQYAVDNQALLVTNDFYTNLTFENEAFKEQIEKRIVGYTWDGAGGDFTLSNERKSEAWYPNLNSVYWTPNEDLPVTRKEKIAEMEARLDDLVPYERQRLVNMKEMEAREAGQSSK